MDLYEVTHSAAVVEIDKPTIENALRLHLQVSAANSILDYLDMDIDPLDQLPDQNRVPVVVNGNEELFEINRVTLGAYADITMVILVSEDSGPAGFIQQFIMYEPFGGMSPVVIRVQTEDRYSIEEGIGQKITRELEDLFHELYVQKQ